MVCPNSWSFQANSRWLRPAEWHVLAVLQALSALSRLSTAIFSMWALLLLSLYYINENKDLDCPKTLTATTCWFNPLSSLACMHPFPLGSFSMQQPGWLWWLILDVNLSRAQGAQIFGFTLYIVVSVRVFPDEISVWINGRSKGDFTYPMWIGLIQPVEDVNRIKRQGREISLSAWVQELEHRSSAFRWELTPVVLLILRP